MNMMHEMENNGIGIDNWDAPIYRIFERKWLLELLRTQKNGLMPPASWDDPFENFFLQCKGVTNYGKEVSFQPLHDSWFGQCWTLAAESDAMWRIYSKKESGVRVSTTIRKLFNSYYDKTDQFAALKFAIGKITYKTRTDIENFLAGTSFADLTMGGQIHGVAETLCIKRPEFSHEAEVRLLFHDAENKYIGSRVVLVPLSTAAVIDDVLLDPRIGSITVKRVTRELVNAGYSGPVSQSELYKFTPPTIRLE
jgi:hypothetical protein